MISPLQILSLEQTEHLSWREEYRSVIGIWEAVSGFQVEKWNTEALNVIHFLVSHCDMIKVKG